MSIFFLPRWQRPMSPRTFSQKESKCFRKPPLSSGRADEPTGFREDTIQLMHCENIPLKYPRHVLSGKPGRAPARSEGRRDAGSGSASTENFNSAPDTLHSASKIPAWINSTVHIFLLNHSTQLPFIKYLSLYFYSCWKTYLVTIPTNVWMLKIT